MISNMEIVTHREKLIQLWELSEDPRPFTYWLIDESKKNHEKSVLMAGDLGQAFSKIGDLERLNKDLTSDRIHLQIEIAELKNNDPFYD